MLYRHLEENLDDWLTEELDNYLDDDYLVFDCPGTYSFLYLSLFLISILQVFFLVYSIYGVSITILLSFHSKVSPLEHNKSNIIRDI